MTQPADVLTANDIPFGRQPAPTKPTAAAATRQFRVLSDDHYVLGLVEIGVEFEVDRLRRKWGELVGELTVRCDLPGARTFEGALSIGDFNLSKVGERQTRGRVLAERSKAPTIDWVGLLEEFCALVHKHERSGQPAVLLREVTPPAPDDELDLDGLRLPRHHASILFADGGTLKSYLSLYLAGRLSGGRARVGFFDWELDAPAHRDRLGRLFGLQMPDVIYVRCDRPLVHELDRLKRIVHAEGIDYVICDSIAFACDGPPEAAESAVEYMRAVRQLGRVGSLHLAHTTKGDAGDQRPFGSTFWHNSARCTWFAKLANTTEDGQRLTLGLFNRKANLGPLRPAIGFEVHFDQTTTTFSRVNVAEVQDLADSLPIWQRMKHVLKAGPRTLAILADELGVKVDTIERTVRRKSALFTRVPGTDGINRIALVERGAA